MNSEKPFFFVGAGRRGIVRIILSWIMASLDSGSRSHKTCSRSPQSAARDRAARIASIPDVLLTEWNWITGASGESSISSRSCRYASERRRRSKSAGLTQSSTRVKDPGISTSS